MEKPLPQTAKAAIQDLCERYLGDLQSEANAAGDIIQVLYDLRLQTVRRAAEFVSQENRGLFVSDDDILDLADALPAYDTQGFYNVRNSFVSIAVAVALGWIMGGIASALLGFVGLGGEILRPCAIFALLWLEDFLSVNPRARKLMLTVLGMGALARFGAALASGLVRFTSLGSLRSLIFGSLPRIGFFKSLWLWFGALLMLVFFAKKRSGLDLAKARTSLEEQISGRFELCVQVLQKKVLAEQEIDDLKRTLEEREISGKCPNGNCGLAAASIAMLDSLAPDHRRHIIDALSQAGFEVKDSGQSRLIWNSAEHASLYNPLGLVQDGDKCIVLSHPWSSGDKIVKGTVQRMPGQRS